MSKQVEISSEKTKKHAVLKNRTPPQNISKLTNARIIQKHLVYVIGLSSSLANKDLLLKTEYFSQYGTVTKIVVNKNKAYNPNGPNGPSYSAYITYSTHHESSIAILTIDNTIIDDHLLRASFGTTKYCTYYLKGLDCPNKDCLYLHYLADPKDIVNRDEMSTNKSIFFEQQLLAIKIADIYNPEVKKKIMSINYKKVKYMLPTTDTIYNKEIVIDNDPSNESYYKYNYYDKNNNYFYKKKYDGYDDEIEDDSSYYNGFNYDTSSKIKENYVDVDSSYRKSSNNELANENKDTNVNIGISSGNKLNTLFKEKKITVPTKSLNSCFKNSNSCNKPNSNTTPQTKTTKEVEKERILTPFLKENKQILETIKDSNCNNTASKNDLNNMITNCELNLDNRKYSNVSNCTMSTNMSIPATKKIEKKGLFSSKDKSRFTFVSGCGNGEEMIDIPQFILDLINKKTSRHWYSTRFLNDYENQFNEYALEKSKNHAWVKFLMNMKNTNTFEDINDLSKSSKSFGF